jgi:hypothetical protein
LAAGLFELVRGQRLLGVANVRPGPFIAKAEISADTEQCYKRYGRNDRLSAGREPTTRLATTILDEKTSRGAS